jgi:hypothetical protein
MSQRSIRKRRHRHDFAAWLAAWKLARLKRTIAKVRP